MRRGEGHAPGNALCFGAMRLPAPPIVLLSLLAFAAAPSEGREREREPGYQYEREVAVEECFLEIDFGAELRAGDVVELRWSALPDDIEEFEILLSLDDGREFGLRVTPELEAGERHYRWRVPNLAAAAARLRMRMGNGHEERLARPSQPFRILADPEHPVEREQCHEGLWWSGVDASSSPVETSLASGASGARLAARRDERSSGETTPHAPSRPVLRQAARPLPHRIGLASPVRSQPAQRSLPQRN